MPSRIAPPAASPAPTPWLAAAVAVAVVFLAYWNSLQVPFVLDDRAAILNNPALRNPSSVKDLLIPPAGGQTVSGRPLVQLSLAFNYAWSGPRPWSYHLTNVLIHACAALTLFGLVRRTLRLNPSILPQPSAPPDRATLLAFAVALLWSVHPLQTSAVTYVVQRAEALAGLFYLLTLYCFARAAQASRPARGFAGAVLACAAGMASKETAVTAPLMVLLYDRTFIAGSFARAWRQRRAVYLALASTWLLLAALLVSSRARGGTVGFDTGVGPWTYLLTQAHALLLYLKLAFWPHPLVFDYGETVITSVTSAAVPGVIVLALLAGTILALRRRPLVGFLGAWFFVILAPTSSIVPIASQTIAEHRMYLPLAAVVVLAVFGLTRLLGSRALGAVLAVAMVLTGVTISRNRTYGTEIALWRDTARHAPQNVRAQVNLGSALLDAGRTEEAVVAYQHAEKLQPDSAEIHAALCQAFTQIGRLSEAAAHGERALRLAPDNPDVRVNLAGALMKQGQLDAAIRHYQAARQVDPDAADIPALLADALVQRAIQRARAGALAAAQNDIGQALQLAPERADVHFTAGNILAAANQLAAAVTAYRRALERAPDDVAARNNLANALLLLGRIEDAIREYERVLQQRPDDASVRANLQEARALLFQPRMNADGPR